MVASSLLVGGTPRAISTTRNATAASVTTITGLDMAANATGRRVPPPAARTASPAPAGNPAGRSRRVGRAGGPPGPGWRPVPTGAPADRPRSGTAPVPDGPRDRV